MIGCLFLATGIVQILSLYATGSRIVETAVTPVFPCVLIFIVSAFIIHSLFQLKKRFQSLLDQSVALHFKGEEEVINVKMICFVYKIQDFINHFYKYFNIFNRWKQ